MKVQVEEISATERRLQVEIPAERVASEYERAFQSVARHAKIRGFRQGRVPRPVLERYFAADVRSEVTSSLVREGLGSALEESKLEIVSQPELDIGNLNEREALRFTARVEIRPDLGEVDTTGLTGQRPRVVITDEDVEKVLGGLRERFAELVPIEDRRDLARGDYATIKIEARVDGTLIPQLSRESGTVEVAAGHLPAPVDERLALARVGDSFTVEAPPPDGAPAELEGKTLEYSVAVNAIAEKRVPELDDEFARDHGDCETLDELRGKIRQQLEADAQRRSEAQLRESVLDQILARNRFELPPSLVTRRVEDLLAEFKVELLGHGLRLSSAEHEDEARGKLRERAEREVASDLLLDRLADQLTIEVNDADLADQIGKMLASAGNSRERLREHYEHEHARDAVRSRMRRARTLERLVSLSTVQDVAPAQE
ncbi:MAG: trigger factor [Deltaproteobacteria bacterium]|nr:trigger factor [Deltaproteobacteria bacterium]